MNESFEETKEKEKFLYRSTSEIMLRTGTEMYDLNDLIDINQINLPLIQIGAVNSNHPNPNRNRF
jgi:hypothetical protein